MGGVKNSKLKVSEKVFDLCRKYNPAEESYFEFIRLAKLNLRIFV